MINVLSKYTVYLLLFFLFASCENETYKQGKNLYELNCANCHGMDARGFQNLYPGLDSIIMHYDNPERIACVIRNGINNTNQIRWVDRKIMPANTNLNTVEIANIVNYLTAKWGKKQYINTKSIESALNSCNESN